MYLGYIGKLLYEGGLDKLKEELSKLPLSYDDVPIIASVLSAIDTNDELSLFYKVSKNEHEVPKEERIKELLERLEESIKIAETIGADTDVKVSNVSKKLIELLGTSIGFHFPGEERFLMRNENYSGHVTLP